MTMVASQRSKKTDIFSHKLGKCHLNIMSDFHLDENERTEVKNLIVLIMGDMIESFKTSQQELIHTDLIDEDTCLCEGEASDYSKHIDLLTYLYDPEMTCVTPRELFWRLDTGVREIIWHKMKENLSKSLFEKIDAHLDFYNK